MTDSSLEAGLGEIFKVPDERILKAVEKAGNRFVRKETTNTSEICCTAVVPYKMLCTYKIHVGPEVLSISSVPSVPNQF